MRVAQPATKVSFWDCQSTGSGSGCAGTSTAACSPEPVVKVLRRDPNATVTVEGHADKRKRSTREYNQKLSERRANAVKDYLVEKSGISAANVKAVGFGFDRPVALNDTEANMQKNRRTDVYIRKGGAK